MTPATDEQQLSELLKRLQRERDAEALAQIVELTREMILQLAYRLLGDVTLAEDLTQDVFLAFVSKYDTIHDPACLCGWLRSVTFRKARGYWRNSNEFLMAMEDLEQVAGENRCAQSPLNHLTADEQGALHHELQNALAGLDSRYQNCLRLLYFERRSASEVAQMMGVSVDTVYVYCSRALAKLVKLDYLKKWL